MKPVFIAFIALFMFGVQGLFSDIPSSREEREGQELAEELRSAVPEEDVILTGVLKIRSRKQAVTNDIPVIFRMVAGEPWEVIYETLPTSSTPPEKLIVRHHTDQPNQYLYARAASPGAPLPALRELEPAEANIPLAGSDFWLSDLGLEFLHWPIQRRLKGDMRLGRSCHVLESVNPAGGKVVRVKSYIDRETGGVLIADAYDQNDRPVKEFSLSGSSFKKVNGRWQLEKMEIYNPQDRSTTVLKFDLERN